MTGVSYITNETGQKTHLVLDLSIKHEKAIREFLEDLADIAIIEATKDEETVSIEDVRNDLIKMGASEKDLAKIPNV